MSQMNENPQSFRPVNDLRLNSVNAVLLPGLKSLRINGVWSSGGCAIGVDEATQLRDFLNLALPKPDGPEVIPWATLEEQAARGGVDINVYVNSMNAHVQQQRREILRLTEALATERGVAADRNVTIGTLGQDIERLRLALLEAAEALQACADNCLHCNYGKGSSGCGSEGDKCEDCTPARDAGQRAKAGAQP